ncbi:MAG TPA: amidohydrolase family protein [Chloroflexota bacterium]|jgi:cytosine deaminase
MGRATDRLLLRDCRLADGATADVLIVSGRIERVAPGGAISVSDEISTFDAGGGLLTPGLTDPHIHPDKAFGLEAEEAEPAATLSDAIARVRAQKPNQTAEAICARTVRLAEWCLSLGTTRARVHAEVDPLLGLRSVEGVLAARAALRGRMHLQVVAFPQEGILREPGTLELLGQAMRLGCDVVGAITYIDPEPRQHLELVAKLANEFGVPLDVHADFGIPVDRSALGTIAEVASEYDLRGRVLVGHATTLATMEPSHRAAVIGRLADAGIDVCCLPRTDLFLDRQVAPLEELRMAGIGAWLGTNNIQNAFTPVGRPSLPSAAAVYALAAGQGARPAFDALAASLWGAASSIIPALASPAVVPGAAADLCLWPCASAWQLVAAEPQPVAVLVGGDFVRPAH